MFNVVLGMLFVLSVADCCAMERKREKRPAQESAGFRSDKKVRVHAPQNSEPDIYTQCRTQMLDDALQGIMLPGANPEYSPNDDDMPWIEYTIHGGSKGHMMRPLGAPHILTIHEELTPVDQAFVHPLTLRGHLLQRRIDESKWAPRVFSAHDNEAHKVKIGYEYKNGKFSSARLVADFNLQEVAEATQRMTKDMLARTRTLEKNFLPGCKYSTMRPAAAAALASSSNLKFIKVILDADVEGLGEEADEESEGLAE